MSESKSASSHTGHRVRTTVMGSAACATMPSVRVSKTEQTSVEAPESERKNAPTVNVKGASGMGAADDGSQDAGLPETPTVVTMYVDG